MGERVSVRVFRTGREKREMDNTFRRNFSPQRLAQSVLQVKNQELNVLPSITQVFQNTKAQGY